MEGAIKLLKFCMEQKEAGNDMMFDYSPHIDTIRIFGYKGPMPVKAKVDDYLIWPSDTNYWTKTHDLTPERADEIINEIKEKLK